MAALSVAHLSLDAGELKLCVGPQGAPMTLDVLPEGSQGQLTRLAYGQVTARLSLPPGLYDLAFAPASDTCPPSTPLFALPEARLDADHAYTVMAIGPVAQEMSLVTTDTTTPALSGGLVRFVHASSALSSVDVGVDPQAWTPIWSAASYASVGWETRPAQPQPDANGYVELPPEGHVWCLGLPQATKPKYATLKPLSVVAGEIATLYATEDGQQLPMLLKCREAPLPTGSWLLPCSQAAMQLNPI